MESRPARGCVPTDRLPRAWRAVIDSGGAARRHHNRRPAAVLTTIFSIWCTQPCDRAASPPSAVPGRPESLPGKWPVTDAARPPRAKFQGCVPSEWPTGWSCKPTRSGTTHRQQNRPAKAWHRHLRSPMTDCVGRIERLQCRAEAQRRDRPKPCPGRGAVQNTTSTSGTATTRPSRARHCSRFDTR